MKNHDFELWIEDAAQKRISNCFSYRIEAEFRFKDNASSLYFAYAQFFLVYHPCKWLELTGGYRHQKEIRRSEDKWETIYDPLGDIVLYLYSGQWKWTDRSRIQYLIHSFSPNVLRYRNRLRLTSPWKLTNIELKPFVDNEVFFEERKGFYQDRFSVGVLTDPTDYLTFETFYMLRYQNILNEWRRHNILGIYLSFKF